MYESGLFAEIEAVHQEVRQVAETVTANHQDDEIEKWLGAADPSVNHNSAKERRHEGTGAWLLLDQRYQTWKAEAGSFLWLSGIAGCGKTFLSSTVIDDLRDPSSPAHLAYFYFDFNDSRKSTVENLLRSLLHQLYRKSEETKKCVQALWAACTRESHKGCQPTSAQMYDALVQVVARLGQVCIVIDALDESTRQGTFTTGTLLFIKRLKHDTAESARILVTSRAEQDIQDSLSSWAREVDMIPLEHSLVQQDIESYIHHELRHGGRFNRWKSRLDLLDLVQSSLMAKANGM